MNRGTQFDLSPELVELLRQTRRMLRAEAHAIAALLDDQPPQLLHSPYGTELLVWAYQVMASSEMLHALPLHGPAIYPLTNSSVCTGKSGQDDE